MGGIIHTVAAGNEAAARQNPHPAITLNVQGTLNVLEAARKNKVQRLVYISTAGVYGRRSDETPIKEDEAITWRGTIYHPSHYMGEILVEMYQQVYGMESVIIRPLSLYGPALSLDKDQHLRTKSLFLGAWIKKALKANFLWRQTMDCHENIRYEYSHSHETSSLEEATTDRRATLPGPNTTCGVELADLATRY